MWTDICLLLDSPCSCQNRNRAAEIPFICLLAFSPSVSLILGCKYARSSLYYMYQSKEMFRYLWYPLVSQAWALRLHCGLMSVCLRPFNCIVSLQVLWQLHYDLRGQRLRNIGVWLMVNVFAVFVVAVLVLPPRLLSLLVIMCQDLEID